MSVAKNYLYNLMYQLTALLVPFITTPYISRVFGADGVGSYAVSYSIAQYFTLFGLLGINSYGSRQIAYCRDNKQECEKAFWNLNYMKFLTMGISIVAYVVYVLFCVQPEKKLLYIAQSFVLFASLFDISWYFAGVEKFKTTALRSMAVKIIGMLLVFCFVKDKNDVWLYALIIAVSLFVGQAIVWVIALKELAFCLPDIKTIIQYMRGTVKLWIPALAINIYTSLDKIMLGFMISDAEAGLYENSQKMIKMVSTITTTFAAVMTPKMSNYYKNGKLDTIKDNVYKSFKFVTILAVPMVFGVMAIRKSFVPWFYGAGFEKVAILLIVSAWLVLTLSWSNVLGNQILIACNRERYYTIAVTVGAVVNLIFNSVFIPNFHSMGAIVSSVIAEYVGMFLMMYFSRDIVQPSILMKGIGRYFVVSFIMFVLVYFVGEWLGYSILTTVIQVIVGIVVYALFLVLSKDSIIAQFINKYKKKV